MATSKKNDFMTKVGTVVDAVKDQWASRWPSKPARPLPRRARASRARQ